MDCCGMGNKHKEKEMEKKHFENMEKVKGGNGIMDRRIIMWIVIGLLFLATLYLTFKSPTTGNVAAVQSAGAAAQSAASSMVGGC